MARNYELWKFGWGSYKGFHRGEISERIGEFTAELKRWRLWRGQFDWQTRLTLRFSSNTPRYHMWLRGDDWADVLESLGGRGRIRVVSRPRKEGSAYLDLDIVRADNEPINPGVVAVLFPWEDWGGSTAEITT